jgi:hypothetical protein
MQNSASREDGWAKRDVADFRKLHSGLAVSMISTARQDFTCCDKSDRIGSVVAGNSENKFDYMPVEDRAAGEKPIIGVLRLADYYSEPATDIGVEERYEPLREVHLIGMDASILSFVLEADKRPFRLLVSERGIVGLVSLSDLQKLPVRVALFGLVTGLEMVMANAIVTCDPQGEKWHNCISKERQKSLNDRIENARKKEGIVNELLFTHFCEKRDILIKLVFADELRRKREAIEKKLKVIENLRNALAHANDYADTNKKATQVCIVTRDILDMHDVIRSRLAEL